MCSDHYFTMFNMLTPFLTLNSLESKNTGGENIQSDSISEQQSENPVDFETHDLTEDADIIAEMQAATADIAEVPESGPKTKDDGEVVELSGEEAENKTSTENLNSEKTEHIDDKEPETNTALTGDTGPNSATANKVNDNGDAVEVMVTDDEFTSGAADTSQESIASVEVTDKAAADKPTTDSNTTAEAPNEAAKQDETSIPEGQEKMDTDSVEQEKAAGGEAAAENGDTAVTSGEGDNDATQQSDQQEQGTQEEESKGDVEQAGPTKVGETKRLVTISHSLAVSCSSWRIGCVFLPAFWACR